MGMISDGGVGVVRRMHHVGLPMCKFDWNEIQAFWESLGLRCVEHKVARDDYDHAGAGVRLQVTSGYHLLVSYFEGALNREQLMLLMGSMHIAVEVDADMLERLRAHSNFQRETNWGHALVSVFLNGPYGLHVECVTRDPDFHTDRGL